MKRRIRLTEGQLYRLIEQALNELDDRTYAHAAQLADMEAKQLGHPYDNFDTPMGKAIAQVQKPRRERQRDAFLDRFNQGVNKKLHLPSDTRIFNKGNIGINSKTKDFDNPPPLNPATTKGKYERQIHNFMKGNAYYDKALGKWVDKYDPEFDINKAKKFNGGSVLNHHVLCYGESNAHNIAENVINKLRRL